MEIKEDIEYIKIGASILITLLAFPVWLPLYIIGRLGVWIINKYIDKVV